MLWREPAARPVVTTAEVVAERIARLRRPNDVVVVSIHWGPNWGYEIPDEQRRFAHALIDNGAASVVHGHSSHHPKAIESTATASSSTAAATSSTTTRGSKGARSTGAIFA